MKLCSGFLILLLLIALFKGAVHGQALLKHPQIKYTSSATDVSSMPNDYWGVIEKLDSSHKLIVKDYVQLLDLFDERDYTPTTWQAGIREIPRLYITEIGTKWGKKRSKEVTVIHKKRIFFRGIAPIVLHANELILEDRNRLKHNITAFELNKEINEIEAKWIKNLAGSYKVEIVGEITDSELHKLLMRVDIIPASLALAQAAAESGWGTSRFAGKGNAMYGQWSWGKDAMIPKEKREHLGNYGVAAFGTIQESVSAYMLNLNTHYAYKDLRNLRAKMRDNNDKISGYQLAEGLISYSEKGESYIKTLRSIMEHNQLEPVDDAYLKNEKPIYLFPEGE